MAADGQDGERLAKYLRGLREGTWPDAELTQAQLAAGLSTEQRVGPATISTWESTTNPKTPNTERLRAYARFFATRRSLDGGPHLIPADELTDSELADLRSLEDHLVGLVSTTTVETRPGTFAFSEGPVTIICPDAPHEIRGPFADKADPNFTQLHRYVDLDALIDLYGHVRAINPTLEVFHRLASEARADDISSHVVLLGGVAWNEAARLFQGAIDQVPITQVTAPYTDHEPFSVQRGESATVFDAQWNTDDDEREVVEDVAFLARLPNPFNFSRTLTICNGVHSRGVLGAVRCLTDERVRFANEDYLNHRFPEGRFALLLRVPVVARATLSPDLQNPRTRLFEWPEENSST